MQLETIKKLGESESHQLNLVRVQLEGKTVEVHALATKQGAEDLFTPETRYYLYWSTGRAMLNWSRQGLNPFEVESELLRGMTEEQLQKQLTPVQ